MVVVAVVGIAQIVARVIVLDGIAAAKDIPVGGWAWSMGCQKEKCGAGWGIC